MPKKVLPDAEAFARFCEWMERRDYRKLTRGEFGRDFVRLGLEAPRHREGREIGFVFYANRLEVRVWTTYLDPDGPAREEDAGWVLIKQGDKAKYFTPPLHRTKNFLRRLYQWADVARFRVLDRPVCPAPSCNAFMGIRFGEGIGSRYWACMHINRHPSGAPEWADWDIGLKNRRPRAYAFVLAERKKRAQTRKRIRAAGGVPGTARRRRKKWGIRNPHNLMLDL